MWPTFDPVRNQSEIHVMKDRISTRRQHIQEAAEEEEDEEEVCVSNHWLVLDAWHKLISVKGFPVVNFYYSSRKLAAGPPLGPADGDTVDPVRSINAIYWITERMDAVCTETCPTAPIEVCNVESLSASTLCLFLFCWVWLSEEHPPSWTSGKHCTRPHRFAYYLKAMQIKTYYS